jgi:molecular chaperone GrpE
MNDSRKTEYETHIAENRVAATNPEGSAPDAAKLGAEVGPTPPSGTPVSVDPIESLRLENAELKDKLLRVLAEMENLRRRTEREVAEAKAYGVTSFAREMLTVADNLRRALACVPESHRRQAGSPCEALAQGIEVTERDFLSRLDKYGVKKLDSLGAKFDPNLHEALFEVPDETVPNGTVVEIVEEGYTIGDRVLRPAKVGVSRGGPKAANENASP